tara:strand:- start:261 stop:530 length:270 start_codon:yes stop_codon:yes gene_type:complete
MTILRDAEEAIKQRHETHGGYHATHRRIARLWGAYLDIDLTETDVARMCILLKVARSKEGNETEEDHAKDIAGYADLLQKLAVWQSGMR